MTRQTAEWPLTPETRGAAYALIAAGFRYPKSMPLPAMAASQLWDNALRPLMAGNGKLPETAGSLRMCLEQLLDGKAESARTLESVETDYAALFGHAVRGACPPYELEYGPGEIVQRASDLADISGFYAAFGLNVASASDRPDHITVECEFMSLLCTKEAAADRAGWPDRVKQCRHAERAFLKDHLAAWLPAFLHRVAEQAIPGFYTQLTSFAREFLDAECRQFALSPGPQWLELRPTDPERDTSIECGPEDSGIPGAGRRFVPLNVSSA